MNALQNISYTIHTGGNHPMKTLEVEDVIVVYEQRQQSNFTRPLKNRGQLPIIVDMFPPVAIQELTYGPLWIKGITAGMVDTYCP